MKAAEFTEANVKTESTTMYEMDTDIDHVQNLLLLTPTE